MSSLLRSHFQGRHATVLDERCVTTLKTAAKETKKNLLIVKQILLNSTIGNVTRALWRIYMLILGLGFEPEFSLSADLSDYDETNGKLSCHIQRTTNNIYLVCFEFWKHVTSCSYPQGTEQHVDYSMDMMKRETVNDIIIFTPLP